jgi:hypothetical protein
MLTVELSDHPGEMLSAATRQRESAAAATLRTHEDGLKSLRAQRDEARRHRRWLRYLRLAFAVARLKRRRPAATQRRATDEEEILRAGIQGERRVAAALSKQLGDDWTLFHGYRNARGEIDHVLLGPKGLFAIEVKNLNATVTVTDDTWKADKYDRYGNLVEQYTITDRRGRSPSVQLNQSADALAGFLYNRGQQIAVRRVVVLAHERSRVADLSKPTVTVVTTAAQLLQTVRAAKDNFGATQRTAIQGLIEQDHRHHNRRR